MKPVECAFPGGNRQYTYLAPDDMEISVGDFAVVPVGEYDPLKAKVVLVVRLPETWEPNPNIAYKRLYTVFKAD